MTTSARSTILTDVLRNVYLEQCQLSPESTGLTLAGSPQWAVRKQRLRGGLADGVDVVELNSGRLTVWVLPTRGMGVWKAECDGVPIGWPSPVAMPVNPAFVNLAERGGLGWLQGFNELICRCGLEFNGPPGIDEIIDNQGNTSRAQLTLHGRIANLPAHFVEVDVSTAGPGALRLTGVVDEAMLFGPGLRLTSTLTLEAGSASFTIRDEITNLKSAPAELELLYHTNLGRPFLEAGARLVAPVRELAPRDPRAASDIATWNEYAAPETGYVEQVHYMELLADAAGQTQVLLHNAAADRGVSLAFNVQQLPRFIVWKNTQAEADGYVTGLEPSVNYPNLKTVERRLGRVVVLPPGGTYAAELQFTAHTAAETVARTAAAIARLQATQAPVIHPAPVAKWSGG